MRALCPGRLRRYRRLMRQLLRALGQKLRLHDAVARLAAREARMVEERPVEAEQGRDSADLVLLEGAKHAPACVLAIEVAEGDEVRAGQVLCIVEAMKMENEVHAPRDGTVRELSVATGEPVTTGQVICVLVPDGEAA